MTHIIVGTAGHIDHGKTALVRALTGIETDRLKEEKTRGISIDLGFAHLDLGTIRAGFVDVPGHERFVKNMLAGATGIDLLLFVVAADEGVKPQTREHFEICRLLGIRRGIIVLTKTDLAPVELREIAQMDVMELVQGSFLEEAPVVAVSSTTGEGISELKDILRKSASQLSERPAGEASHFRMPVDRAFTMRGFGPVVTGTVHAGSVRLEEELAVYPEKIPVRIRGIQTHGQATASATAGQRTAINLAGIDIDSLRRGQVLAPREPFRPTEAFLARLDLIPTAPPLKNRSPVHLHLGTAQIEAEIRFLERDEARYPDRPAARILLAEPALILPGDRFILRRSSPLETIAGGIVVDSAPPRKRRKDLAVWIAQLEQSDVLTRIGLYADSAPHGLSRQELIARGGFTGTEIDAAGLQSCGEYLLTNSRLQQIRGNVAAKVTTYHREHPLAPGIAKEELRVGTQLPAAILEAAIAGTPSLSATGEFVRAEAHRPNLGHDESAALRKIEAAFQRAGLQVPSVGEVLAASGVDASRANSLLQILLRSGKLTRITPDLVFHSAAIAGLREQLAARRGQRFGVTDFKNWTGVSRKYAIPLLEYLDRTRITRRDGDSRLILCDSTQESA